MGQCRKIVLVKSLAKQINFYPNPAINELHFTGLTSNSTITLFNLTGKSILSQKILNNTLQIPVNIRCGTYIMHVKTNNGSTFTLKVSIAK